MCGRIDQNHNARFYAHAFGWADVVNRSQAAPRFNAPPGTFRPLMHIEDEQACIDDLYWGYRARGCEGKVPIAVNARMNKIQGRYWSRLLKAGRAIVPADGWYEWTGEKGSKQPWHIHAAGGEPLFMLALANFGSGGEHPSEAGFVIVTADADDGMLALHDRRPLVLRPADAALWLDPFIAPDQAVEIARSAALGREAFAWHPVSTELNRATSEGAHLVAAIAADPELAELGAARP